VQKKLINLALFGGSFDPFHLGHLSVLKAVQQVDFISYIVVMPAAQSPLKEVHHASSVQRMDMVKLGVRDLAVSPPIIVSDMEIVRGEPSYTIDTVLELKARYMPDVIYLVLGSDSYAELSRWHEAEKLVDMVKLLIIDREKFPVSSTDIRAKLRANESVEDLVPDAVFDYMRKNRLY
jgi:nicotinate-nucleotide adenylyltransferase